MSAPYDPRNICCHRCWENERDSRASEEAEDYWRNGRIEVRLIAAQEPVWIDYAGHIFCGDHIPSEFFLELKSHYRGGACETCGAEPQPTDNFPGFGLVFEDMLQAPSGRIFCSTAHIPPEELRTKPWVRVGPCEGCGREIHKLGGQWKDGKPPRLFCSSRCHIRFYDLRKQARRAHDKQRCCTVCGKTFEPRQSNAVTCSPACRQKAYRVRRATA